MLPDFGTVMVLIARFSDCPAASVYGPLASAADCNTGDVVGVTIAKVLASKVTAPFGVVSSCCSPPRKQFVAVHN